MKMYQFSTYQDFRIYQFSYMHESKLETLYEQLCDFHEYERKLEMSSPYWLIHPT